MITARTARMTSELRQMTVEQADRALCRMSADDLLAIGEDLGLRLPLVGGDKPAVICARLNATRRQAAVDRSAEMGWSAIGVFAASGSGAQSRETTRSAFDRSCSPTSTKRRSR